MSTLNTFLNSLTQYHTVCGHLEVVLQIIHFIKIYLVLPRSLRYQCHLQINALYSVCFLWLQTVMSITLKQNIKNIMTKT